jgi:hypothetical protein
MKGLELSEKFYLDYGQPMLREQFPDLLPHVAVGLCGGGSECFGYDDSISHDHDFEPGFRIFLPDEQELDRKAEFQLERAYEKLPREFSGYRRSTVAPAGGKRHGVIRRSSFFSNKTGTPDGNLTLKEWFFVPEQSLAEATNGKIFFDGDGKFTAIRQKLAYLPEDVRLKRLAGNFIIMEQSGVYNYPRLITRGETAAAQLAITEFAKSAINAIFLINRRYVPYYKWTFRALRELDILSYLHTDLEYLISSPNTKAESEQKLYVLNKIINDIIEAVLREGLSDSGSSNAESHAMAINRRIVDTEIRNLNILYGI